MPIEIPDSRKLSDEVLEALRTRAVHAREQGFSIPTIARVLGLARETVSRWCHAYMNGGVESLPGRKTGRPVGSGRRLTAKQEDEIIETVVAKCPDECDIPMALWTRRAVRELIHRKCGVQLSVRTVGDYLQRWGFTPQKPVRRSYRQNSEEVRKWLDEEYPAIAARAAAEDAEIHWGDETGIRSDTFVGRGYAVPQQPPELHVSGRRFSVNMISSVTSDGKGRWMMYDGKMDATRYIEFLRRLISRSDRKVFLIVDRLRVHEAAAVQVWLYERRDKIETFGLPKYSPELNPDEYLNGDLKQEVNKDGLPNTRDELAGKVRRDTDIHIS